MGAYGLRGGRLGRCLALALVAPVLVGPSALAQPVLPIPPAAVPVPPPPQPPVDIPELSVEQIQTALKVLKVSVNRSVAWRTAIRSCSASCCSWS